jgi:Skp family chaperone for outer membrane proteins
VSFLKQIFELARQLLLLTESLQKVRTDLNAVQKELKEVTARTEVENRELRSAIERLAFEFQRLHDEVRHGHEREEKERHIFQLQIENQLLRASR